MAPNRASDHATQYRTHSCGELRAEHAARPGARPAPPPIADELDVLVPRRPATAGPTVVTLSGYVDERVDEFSFLLRDHYGRTLVKADQSALPYVPDRFKKAGREDVVQVTGAVQLRLSSDPGLQTGEIEVICTQIEPPDAADVSQGQCMKTQIVELKGKKNTKFTLTAVGTTTGGNKKEEKLELECEGPKLVMKGMGYIEPS